MEILASGVTSHLVVAELGLLFVIAVRTVDQKRFFRWSDLWRLIVYTIFCETFVFCTLLVWGYSPLVSFFIGLACQDIWPNIRKGLQSTAKRLAEAALKATDTKEDE
jgi:hypothetical protein